MDSPGSDKPSLTTAQLMEHTTEKLADGLSKKRSSDRNIPQKGTIYSDRKKPPPCPPVLEPPANGDQYTRIEAVTHLRKTTFGSCERKRMMDQMIGRANICLN
mmetsp:Transcript_10446/g.22125  ORF Transcript_10446/g.22125 Transcript_10446/m.22125 type:complete len:103 (-) Transcript_10446:203-511(-)